LDPSPCFFTPLSKESTPRGRGLDLPPEGARRRFPLSLKRLTILLQWLIIQKKARGFEDEGDIDAAIKEAKQAMKADSSSSRPGSTLELRDEKKPKSSLNSVFKWVEDLW